MSHGNNTGASGNSGADIGWIYEFWAGIRDYVYVREEDDVVILPPNKVYKTNKTGVQVLRYLNSGGKFEKDSRFTPAMLGDVVRFMGDIRDIERGEDVTTEAIPYDFDFTRLPILGEIAVTYRCNNSCHFCYAGCGSEQSCSKGHVGDSSLRDIEKIIEIFRNDAKIPFFSFTGGEPLLRDDLEAMIAYATDLKLRVNLITNATLATKERARSLYEAGLRTAQVSVESPDAAVHDALCGVDGAWKRTIDGINALQSAGISVQTNSTLTRVNRASLAGMPEFLASIGVGRFSMNLYIPQPGSPHASELFVRYSETGSFVDDMRKRAAASGRVFFWYSPTPLCIYNPVARGLGNKSCAAADGLISVDPAGNVLPCSSYPEPLGNLLTRKFADVWFSGRAAHFKRKRYAPDTCVKCLSFVACQAACPLYWAYAGYGELEELARKQSKMEAI